jgi:hypothetical protein
MGNKIWTALGLCCAATLTAGHLVANADSGPGAGEIAKEMADLASPMSKSSDPGGRFGEYLEDFARSEGSGLKAVEPRKGLSKRGAATDKANKTRCKKNQKCKTVEKTVMRVESDDSYSPSLKRQMLKTKRASRGLMAKRGKRARAQKRVLEQMADARAGVYGASSDGIASASDYYFEWDYEDGTYNDNSTEIDWVSLFVPKDMPDTLFGMIAVEGASYSPDGTITWGSDTAGVLIDTTGDASCNVGTTSGGYMLLDQFYTSPLLICNGGGATGYEVSLLRSDDYYGFVFEDWRGMGLSLMAPVFGLKDNYFNVFEQQAAGVETGVSAMYALGIAHQQPAGSHRYVNVPGSDELITSTNSPAVDGQQWQELSNTRAELESRLQDLANQYNPVDPNATHLADYLAERRIPTRFDFADTYRVQRHDGPIVCDGGICFPLYYEYSVVSVEGYFDGDHYRTREVTRAGKDRERSQMEQRRDQLALAAAKATVKRLPVASNSTGRAADLDAQRTAAAALGEVMSWNSATPVAEGRYMIESPTAGPIAVSRSESGHPRYPLFGTARSALDGEWFEIEKVGLNEYILKSQTRGYVQTGDATLAGGATRDQAHRFDIRTSDDGRTWFQSVTWTPHHFWIGEERRGHIDVFRFQDGDMANDFANGYDEDHFFTLMPVK